MTSIRRYEDWPLRLDAAILALSDREFQYGDYDCALVVAELIAAMTGADFAEEFRYDTKLKSLRIIRDKGDGTIDGLADYVATRWELPECGINFANRGDPVLCDTELGRTFGVIDLTGRLIVCAAARGFVRLPLATGVRAWHLG